MRIQRAIWFVVLAAASAVAVAGTLRAENSAEWKKWADTCIKALDSEDYNVRDGAAYSLVKLGPDVIPSLVGMLSSDNPEKSAKVREIMMRMGAPAVERLKAMVDEKKVDQRLLAEISALVENFKEMNKEEIMTFLDEAFDQQNYYMSEDNIKSKLKAFGRGVVPVLIDYWKSDEFEDRKTDNYRYNMVNSAIAEVMSDWATSAQANDMKSVMWTNPSAIKPYMKLKGKEAEADLPELFKAYCQDSDTGKRGRDLIFDIFRENKTPEALRLVSEYAEGMPSDWYEALTVLSSYNDPSTLPTLKKMAAKLEQAPNEPINNNVRFGGNVDYYAITGKHQLYGLICKFGDKEGLEGFVRLLEDTGGEEDTWRVNETVNNLRRYTDVDLTSELRPFNQNRDKIAAAYKAWLEQNGASLEWDGKASKFVIKK